MTDETKITLPMFEQFLEQSAQLNTELKTFLQQALADSQQPTAQPLAVQLGNLIDRARLIVANGTKATKAQAALDAFVAESDAYVKRVVLREQAEGIKRRVKEFHDQWLKELHPYLDSDTTGFERARQKAHVADVPGEIVLQIYQHASTRAQSARAEIALLMTDTASEPTA